MISLLFFFHYILFSYNNACTFFHNFHIIFYTIIFFHIKTCLLTKRQEASNSTYRLPNRNCPEKSKVSISKYLLLYETLNNSPSKFMHISSILSRSRFFEFSLLSRYVFSDWSIHKFKINFKLLQKNILRFQSSL